MDFLFVIDSDEYVVIEKTEFFANLKKIKEYKTSPYIDGDGDDKTAKDKPEVYGIKIFEKHVEKPDCVRERYIERVFYKPAKLRYKSIHCNLIDVDNLARNFTTTKYTSEISGITLYNNDDLRSNHYLQRSIEYQRNLLKREAEARGKIF